MNYITYVAVVLATIVVAAFGTAFARGAGKRHGLLDVPNERSSHVQPTPRTGGLAIILAAALAWAMGLLFPEVQADRGFFVLVTGSMAAGAMGFIDDSRHLEPAGKLFGMFTIALPAVLLMPMEVPGWPLWLTSIGAIVWILGFTNMFNFMDGSDGLAGGVSVILGSVLAIMALGVGSPTLAWFSLALAAAALGFLRHNAPPASVFMGDSGSFFLGYAFAVLALLCINAGARPVAVLIVMYPLLFDATLTLVSRMARREIFWRAHRQHLYQRLLVAGWSHEQVARRYYLWQVIAVACGLSYEYGDERWRAVAVVMAVMAAFVHLGSVVWEERRATLTSPVQ